MAQIWDKQPYDTNKSYARFQQFLMLGPERTYGKLCDLLGVGMRTIQEMGVTYNWYERAEAYDAYISSQAMAEHKDRIISYDTAIRSEAIADHDMLVADWRAMYAEMINKPDLKPADLESLLRARELIDKFGRRQLGMPTSYKDSTSKEDSEAKRTASIIPLTWHDAPRVIPGKVVNGSEDSDPAASSKSTEDL